MIKKEDLSFDKIKVNINKAGNLFYQYRACRRDAATIYDIENIRHGVVYARTPLEMNDPFDSMVGFSAEKIFDELIDLAFDQIDKPLEPNIRLILKNLLKYRLVGKTLDFIDALNKLKKYIFTQSIIAHVSTSDLPKYIMWNTDRLYKKCPAEVKKYFDKNSFLIFSLIIKDYQNVPVEEKTITDALKAEEVLTALEEKIIEIRDQTYLPFIRDFLSKLTVVCFSASGWDNQLMWAHYANSYSGICVEYDFEKMDKFIGFMYPVDYSDERPSLSLKDLGLRKFEKDENGNLKTEEIDMSAIFSYMLAKNKCWQYEEEWRIINNGDNPYTPIFVETPFIRSITLGLNLDEMCRQLIWDVCREQGIECYQLVTNPGDYVLTREKLTQESFPFDEEKELEYINLLSVHTTTLSEKMAANSQIVVEGIEKGSLEVNAMCNVLTATLDFLSDAYFLKTAFTRYCKNKNVQAEEFGPETQIGTAIVQINEFISKAKEGAVSINDSVANFVLTGKMTIGDFRKTKKVTSDSLELVEKHDQQQWFENKVEDHNKNSQDIVLQ